MLYITTYEVKKEATGIEYKIYKQIQLFRSCGYDVKLFNHFADERLVIKMLHLLPFLDVRYNYDEIAKEKNVSAVYIRYFFCDAKLIKTLKVLRKNNPGIKIIVEIPTYPYDGEKKFAVKLFKDYAHRKEMKGLVDRIVTFSDDKQIFGIPTLVISNAVDMQKITINQFTDPGDGRIHLASVAQFGFWHGYDRMIEGLHQYYEKGGKQKFCFHIVGYAQSAKVQNEYEHLVEKYHLKDDVIFHGKQFGEALDKIYSICSLAVDSLGRHRSKVYYNSSLKGKEYMAKGIPIISGVNTEMDREAGYPYYFRAPADETPVDFFAVEKFYHQVYDTRSHEQVAEEMREYCGTHFDFVHAYKPLIDFLKVCNKGD